MAAHDLLAGRTIIVTGAATGIGQAFAVGAAAQGANVLIADMHAADETVAAVEAVGGQALAVRVDMAVNDLVQAMARAAVDRFGRIDGLINNAACFREVKLTPFEALDPAPWDRTFAVNVKGTLVAASDREIVIHRKDPRAGDLHIHLPRLGFDLVAS